MEKEAVADRVLNHLRTLATLPEPSGGLVYKASRVPMMQVMQIFRFGVGREE